MPSGDGGFGQLWRWPLYSPRRFFSCIAVVLLLIAGSNMVLGAAGSGKPGPDAASGTPSPAPATSDSGTPTDSPSTQVPPAANGGETTTSATPTPSPKPARPGGAVQAQQVALLFTTAWVDHNRPQQQWLAAISRYADPEFAAQLRSVDPKNVPAGKVAGQPHATAVFFASATVEIPTDAGVMVISLVSDGTAWRVTDISPKQV
jgi:hypothetical protein